MACNDFCDLALNRVYGRAKENGVDAHSYWTGRMKPALKLDAVDLRILEAVQGNARITKIALAEKVGCHPHLAGCGCASLRKRALSRVTMRALPIAKSRPSRM